MKKFFSFLACAAMLIGAVSLSSCSDDDDDNQNPATPATVKSVDVKVTMEVSGNMTELIDLEASCDIANGKGNCTVSQSGSTYTINVKNAAFPNSFNAILTKVRKEDVEAADPEDKYDLYVHIKREITQHMSDGTTNQGRIIESDQNKIGVHKVEEYITKFPTTTVPVTINADGSLQ